MEEGGRLDAISVDTIFASSVAADPEECTFASGPYELVPRDGISGSAIEIMNLLECCEYPVCA